METRGLKFAFSKFMFTTLEWTSGLDTCILVYLCCDVLV
jgi:hypothetical protein